MQKLLVRDVELPVYISAKVVTQSLSIAVLCLTLTGAISACLRVLNYPFEGSKWFYQLFNLDAEFNIPSWYSTFSLLFCSGLLTVIASTKKKDAYFRYWKTLSAIFFVLGLDEAFSFHEILIIPSLRKSLHLNPLFYQTWVIPGVVLVGIFAWKYLKFLRHLPKRTRYLFLLAAAIYISGALGMEMVGGLLRVDFGRLSPLSSAGVVAEESLEMSGVLLFIYALIAYLSSFQESIYLKIYFSEE